jgi:tetratricopeptide (TPR) repeat protein
LRPFKTVNQVKNGLLSLAEIAMENDQIDEAFDYLDRISSESPFYPRALLISADLYQLIGIPEVSEAKLVEAQKLLPQESLIRFALAELYFQQIGIKKQLPFIKSCSKKILPKFQVFPY